MGAAKEIAAAARALGAYRFGVLPLAARELRRWHQHAEAIPDPGLRDLALAALAEKASNVEAVAVFATLAPRRQRKVALAAIVSLQVAVDYVDSLEEVGEVAAGRGRDGGYLERLQATWRQALATLPSSRDLGDFVERAARRSAAAQARTHAAEHGDPSALEAWAWKLPASAGYRWWELAAGASSSVAAHALIAAAAAAGTRRREAELIDAAYNPSIGALTVLLDNLVDREQDAGAGAHNYTRYYADAEEAAERLAAIARAARLAIAPLPRHGRHEAILAGVAAFYVSQPGAHLPFAQPAGAALRSELGPAVGLIAAAIRAMGARTGA